jgi:hypothetical protein
MTQQLQMFDLDDAIAREIIERLPKKPFIPAVEVAEAADVPTENIYEWWEAGLITGWDCGTSRRRYLKIHRKSFIAFINRRSMP